MSGLPCTGLWFHAFLNRQHEQSFFPRHAMTFEEPTDDGWQGPIANRITKSFGHLGQGEVGLLGDPTKDQLQMGVIPVGPDIPAPLVGLKGSSGINPRYPPDGGGRTDTKAFGGRTARGPFFNRRHDTLTEIHGNGFWT